MFVHDQGNQISVDYYYTYTWLFNVYFESVIKLQMFHIMISFFLFNARNKFHITFLFLVIRFSLSILFIRSVFSNM